MTDLPTEDNNGSMLPANWRQLAAMLGLLALAVAGLNYSWQPASQSRAETGEEGNGYPDMIVTTAHIDEFDADGRKIRHLDGEKVEHFEQTQQSVISAPQLHFEQKEKGGQAIPWQLTADTATLFHDSSKIDLQGNVILWSDATPQGRTEIRSELLHVDTAKQFAETDKAVTIRARHSEAKATGLRADLANERLLLPSRVKEIHEVRR